MVEFIVRARGTPADPDRFRASIGAGQGVEYLADIIRSSLFISQGHRDDTILHLVLEKSADYSRVVTLDGARLGSVEGLHERDLLGLVAMALDAGRTLGKEQAATTPVGLEVKAQSFERLVKSKAASLPVYLLDRKGQDVRDIHLGRSVAFVMTDHTPMPKKSFNSMSRQGVEKLSVGPVMLHAAQCISVLHNELDRLG